MLSSKQMPKYDEANGMVLRTNNLTISSNSKLENIDALIHLELNEELMVQYPKCAFGPNC